jgi:hypothetical protein
VYSSPDRFERGREEDRYIQALIEEFVEPSETQPKETPIASALAMKHRLPAVLLGLYA